ncbi:hypothetical protein ABZY19_39050 [Streptomyces sp. NPDC006475]
MAGVREVFGERGGLGWSYLSAAVVGFTGGAVTAWAPAGCAARR